MFGKKAPKYRPGAWFRGPAGTHYVVYDDMAKQPHLLIAGATGSGKSVVVNGIIYTLLTRTPADVLLYLIDPKRVELVRYRKVPHTIRYASEPADMVKALEEVLDTIENRFREMAKHGQLMYTGADIYVVIDEVADLLTTNRREVKPLLQRIAQIGRAARVHLIMATQRPTASVISADITVNLDARVGLRCRCQQDSRNVIYQAGCEQLPRYGQGYYLTPEGLKLLNIPMYTPEQFATMLDWWTSSKCAA